MQRPHRLVVFDAHMIRALVVNDRHRFSHELMAFDSALSARRFRSLVTDGILNQYLLESIKPPQFEPVPVLNKLFTQSKAIRFDEDRLHRSAVELVGLPKEHSVFVLDAIAAQAEYLVTNRPEWLRMPELNQNMQGLQIVNPETFVQLES